MTRRVFYDHPDFYAVAEDGVLVEYGEKKKDEQSGDWVIGQIDRMMPGMGCAFVRIGRKKDGYLPLAENSRSYTGKPFRSGDIVLLQIRKEETGEKGAFLSGDLTMAGTHVLLMPRNRYVGVSRRIEDEDTRQELSALGKKIAGERFGLVMRQESREAAPEEIAGEAEVLYRRWMAIEQAAEACRKPGTVMLHQDEGERILQDYEGRGGAEREMISALSPALAAQLKRSGERKIGLENGGNIVIDRCEAMTVIDVNTGNAREEGNREATFLRTNVAACQAIAVQARLRNIGGIIIIDFIDMESDAARETVQAALAAAFAADRRKTVIHGWTSLGLMEMTRKRV